MKRFAISISVFTVLGHAFLGFETSWAAVIVSLGTGYALELALETLDSWVHSRPRRFAGGMRELILFLLPIHIGALAISMLLYPGEQLWPFAFAVAVAVCAKYLVQAPVRGRMRHTLNPSNLGLAATLFLFPWVGVGLPYQFTENVHYFAGGVLSWIIPFGIFASGIMLNWKLTKRMPLILSWMAAFALQAIMRGLSGQVSLTGGLATMTGTAFLLFTTYMITDPGTSPTDSRGQMVFGASCALVYGVLMYCNIAYGIFYCVVIVCLARTLLLWGQHLFRARVRES